MVKDAYPPLVEDSAAAAAFIWKQVVVAGFNGEFEVERVATVQPVASVAAEPLEMADISPVPEPDVPEAGMVKTDGVNAELDIYILLLRYV
jgi:hypothetical protein